MMTSRRLALVCATLIACTCAAPPTLAQTAGASANTETSDTRAASQAERRQMVEDMSPRGQAQLAHREAQAAYQEATSQCRTMRGNERSACMKEARNNLRSDLAAIKQTPTSGR